MPQKRSSSRPPIVLIVSDQQLSASSLEEILGDAGYAVVRATPHDLSLQFVHGLHPDAVLVGCAPAAGAVTREAIKLAHRIRFATNAATPIVITTTGMASGGERIAAHDAGVWEVLHVPVDRELFVARINSYVRAKREFDRVRNGSLHDAIQDIYSFRGITHRFREIWALAVRTGRPVACIAVSADVESDGRRATDEFELEAAAFEYVASVCRHVARASDVIGRISKTELAIIAATPTQGGAEAFVRRLKSAVEAAPLVMGNAVHVVRLRAGISAIPDFSATPLDTFEPLYRALTTMRGQQTSPSLVPTTADDRYSATFA